MNDKTRAGWSFRASFVKVIKTENSLYLINEDRWDIYIYMTFFHYFQAYNQLPKWIPQVTKHSVYIYIYIALYAYLTKIATVADKKDP